MTRAFARAVSTAPLLALLLGAVASSAASAGTVTTVAGDSQKSGFANGVGTLAKFDYPYAIAVNGSGAFAYVADTSNNVIRRIAVLSATVSTVAGIAGTPGSSDGTGSSATFSYPYGIAVDSAGSFALVSDTYNQLLRRVSLPSGAVTTIAGSLGVSGWADGLLGRDALFNLPQGVAMNARGSVALVADMQNHAIRLVSVAPVGAVTTLAGRPDTPGALDGIGSAASFKKPQGVSLDSAGVRALVADTGNNLIRAIFVATGLVWTVAGSSVGGAYSDDPGAGFADGVGSNAAFCDPAGVAMSSSGTFGVVADSCNYAVRLIVLETRMVTTIAGSWNHGSADGVGTLASFKYPVGVALDSSGKNALVVRAAALILR